MDDTVTFGEGACQKQFLHRVPAEESDEVTNCSSGSRTRRFRKRGSPKRSKGDAETAIEVTLSPVCQMFSAASDSEGYHTCYPSDSTGIQPDFPADRSHTVPNSQLGQKAEQDSLSRRAATTRVPRDTDYGGDGSGTHGRGRRRWRRREDGR